MDYETVLEEQLEATELSELEDSLADAAQQSGVLEELSVEDLVHRLLNGQQILDSDQILENLKNLFLLEVRSSLMLGCEILAVCILIGMLTSFSDSFGKRTVSSLGTVICSCVIIALCMGNFYQSYEYCQDALGTMAHSMEILLPVMIPLLVAMGGISSGSILDPAVAGAVTGFSALMEHIVLPLVFLSAVFTMINSITEKDYVKKLAGFLRKGTIFLTGLAVTEFTGIAAIQGMVTKAADGILINTTKYSLDNFVPIVGGFAADSLDMVISCVGLIKNAIGVAGILLILALLVIPVLKILAVAVIYKITAIAAEPVASKNISDSLNELGTAAITMTVVLAIGALMFLIFIAIIMGMGGGGRWN